MHVDINLLKEGIRTVKKPTFAGNSRLLKKNKQHKNSVIFYNFNRVSILGKILNSKKVKLRIKSILKLTSKI